MRRCEYADDSLAKPRNTRGSRHSGCEWWTRTAKAHFDAGFKSSLGEKRLLVCPGILRRAYNPQWDATNATHCPNRNSKAAVRIGTLRGSRFSLAGPKRRRPKYETEVLHIHQHAPSSSSSYLLPSRDAWRYHSPLPLMHFDRLSDFQSFTLTAPITPLPDVIDLYLWKWILKNTAHSGHHRFPRDHFYPAIFHLAFERLLGQLDSAPDMSEHFC